MSETSNSMIHTSIIMFAVSMILVLVSLISNYVYKDSCQLLLISSILFVGSFITAFKSSKLKENIRKEAFINTSLSVFILGL